MRKIKWNIIYGMLITCAFFLLLLVRLEFFQKNEAEDIKISTPYQPQDIWMNIYQNNQKIGFVHRTFTRKDERFLFNENVLMNINTMGLNQAINILTEGELNPDMTLSSFNFNLSSGIFRFNARGHVVKDKLILFTGLPDALEKSEIHLKDIPHISGSIYDAAFYTDLEKEKTGAFNIFDPSTMSIRSIKVTRNADEIILIMGKRVLTKKYCTDFMGVQNCAWLDKEGNILKETGLLGISMERTSKEKAMEGSNYGKGIDFTQLVSIPSNVKITDPQKINVIKINISGINDSLFLNGDRQSYHQNTLTIIKENVLPISKSGLKIPSHAASFLNPSPFIQSNHQQIKTQLEKIITHSDTDDQKAKKIIDWVYRNIEKKPILSVPNALEVLKNKSGDCNEHSVLTVALLRAAGIPAQVEAGLVYLRGRFYYHAWCVLYLDNWITADSVFNQFPADVTHIRLVRGDSDKQLNLIGVIGKMKLEVLEIIR
ncbi:MAG: transglutaminase domain-containing protein [Syntrophaceae bacterium]|nr:transglutaminase domain-containing protein [Syntrophaceae bacterium]